MNGQLNNLKFQFKNIELQFNNIEMQLNMMSSSNIKSQIMNIGIQILNVGIQTLLYSKGLMIGMGESIEKINNLEHQVSNIADQLNNIFPNQMMNPMMDNGMNNPMGMMNPMMDNDMNNPMGMMGFNMMNNDSSGMMNIGQNNNLNNNLFDSTILQNSISGSGTDSINIEDDTTGMQNPIFRLMQGEIYITIKDTKGKEVKIWRSNSESVKELLNYLANSLISFSYNGQKLSSESIVSINQLFENDINPVLSISYLDIRDSLK